MAVGNEFKQSVNCLQRLTTSFPLHCVGLVLQTSQQLLLFFYHNVPSLQVEKEKFLQLFLLNTKYSLIIFNVASEYPVENLVYRVAAPKRGSIGSFWCQTGHTKHIIELKFYCRFPKGSCDLKPQRPDH